MTWARTMKIDSSIQPRTRRMDVQTDIVTPWAPDGAKNAFISVKMMLSLKDCFSENVFTLMKSKSTCVRREKTQKNGLILILHTKISRTHRATIFTSMIGTTCGWQFMMRSIQWIHPKVSVLMTQKFSRFCHKMISTSF